MFFISFLFSRFYECCFPVCPCVISVIDVIGCSNQSLIALFCILWIPELMHLHNHQYWWLLFLCLFLMHGVSLSSLECKVLYIVINFLVLWSIFFSFFSYLQGSLPKYFILWLDFCCRVWFQEYFCSSEKGMNSLFSTISK